MIVKLAIQMMERGLLPDTWTRRAIRHLCAKRLEKTVTDNAGRLEALVEDFVLRMDDGPIACVPELANEQHYEVPASFFAESLGARRKYSCCYFPEGVTTLDDAEEAALSVTCERAELAEGQDILELGCGWGSLTLWMAERYPGARITGVSNSSSQREFILARARERGFENVEIITCDMNRLELDRQFDRVVSVEMFEHMRNWRQLLENVSSWLRPGGKLFIHVFSHATTPYTFEVEGPDDWMSQYFFSGGMMPSHDLFERFQDELRLEERWLWNGTHYEKTANAWLEKLDARRDEVRKIFAECYGSRDANLWIGRWRIFFMACAELFGFDGGREWGVTHVRFVKG